MPYVVQKSDGLSTITIPDNTIDVTDTSLSLIGRNYPNYGQALADNFVHMLENFSSPTSPSNPIRGQAWYDSSIGKFNIFDGLQWNPVNVVYRSTATSPTLTVDTGDLLVYTDPTDPNNNQIKIWNGTNWTIPANVDLTSSSITEQAEETTATSSAYLVVSDGGQLYSITKSNFLGDTVTPNLVQTGMIMVWPMDYAPTGWIFCDGAAYSTSTYGTLFSVIKDRFGTYGSQYRVPNLTGPTTTGTVVTTRYIIKT